MFLIFFLMATASSYLSDSRDPAAPRMPPEFAAPGVTMSMLLPRLAIESSTLLLTPMPMETMAMTAATPMMMPSMVRMERSLFANSSCRAMVMLSQINKRLPSYTTSILTPLPSSRVMRPSRTRSCRLAQAAMSGSCVTRMIVRPAA